MNYITTREIHVEDVTDSEVQQVADLMSACAAEVDPKDPPFTTGFARGELHGGTAVRTMRRLFATAGDEIVGLGELELHHDDANKHILGVYLQVHPTHRRQGAGTMLLEHALKIGIEEDRSSVLAWGVRSEVSAAFWDTFALPEKQVERMSRLRLADVDQDLMTEWRTTSTARPAGYTLHSWLGACPDELLTKYVEAYRAMYDAPFDELDLSMPEITEESIRVTETNHADRGMTERVVLALDPDCAPAAVTEIALLSTRPWHAWQQGTSTIAAHRGQGLGRWIKAEMVMQLLEEHPEVAVIETGNASTNASMLNINNAMGFEVHEEETARQASLVDVLAAVEAHRSSRG
ncbi:MAG: GNAT family N-acetyltransferase [Acidimicrobiales bacterium]|nr:MAG: GNAT family N-acetyltransferase [Acidimicrobiales bacterium]